MMDSSHQPSGLRERKRLETLDRISGAALRLFVENGYEPTTLDDIAEAAGISRRTFFYYYKSKDDVLVALQCEPAIKALGRAFEGIAEGVGPFAALRERLPRLVASFETERTMIVGDILDSSDALRVRKLAIYIDMEDTLLRAMKGAWPDLEGGHNLRMLAAISMCVLRLSMDQWRQQAGSCSLADFVTENFDSVARQIR